MASITGPMIDDLTKLETVLYEALIRESHTGVTGGRKTIAASLDVACKKKPGRGSRGNKSVISMGSKSEV